MESTIVSHLPSCSCSALESCAAESECNDAPWCSQHAHRRLIHYKTSMTTYQAFPAEGGSKWSPTPRALLLLLLLLLLFHHQNLRLGLHGTLKGVEGEEWLALYLKLSRRHGQRLATTPAAPWVRPLKKWSFIAKKQKDQMGGALVFEVRSAAAPRKRLMVKLLGPTAQVIAGEVKPSQGNLCSLQTLNPKPPKPEF